MDVKGRRDEYAELTRSAIVEAAIARFAAEGFAKTSIDAVAETARVSKGAVYHHFVDKADLFEAAFTVMEERLLAKVAASLASTDEPWEMMAKGIDAFLAECSEPDFRRIAVEDAPAALGWERWKQIEEGYFLGLVIHGLEDLARAGLIDVPMLELTARMFLAAVTEAGLAVAAADDPDDERRRVGALLMRFLEGLR